MFYLLDKPKGISSFKAINNFAKENNIKKVGHTGTLDPMATGLLLIATDYDTKLIEYVDKGFKTYNAHIRFGFQSNTYDTEGDVTKTGDTIITINNFLEITKRFIGEQMQMPPAFSAKKINGVRAYEKARKNEAVKLKEVMVNIKRIDNVVELSNNEFSFDVEVSRGTYIRSLIHDMGKLHDGAIMSYLRRTEIDSLTENDLNAQIVYDRIIKLPKISNVDYVSIFHGKSVPCEKEEGTYALWMNNNIIGVIEVKGGSIKPIKLFGKKYQEELNNESI